MDIFKFHNYSDSDQIFLIDRVGLTFFVPVFISYDSSLEKEINSFMKNIEGNLDYSCNAIFAFDRGDNLYSVVGTIDSNYDLYIEPKIRKELL
jgi:hypothetical protein